MATLNTCEKNQSHIDLPGNRTGTRSRISSRSLEIFLTCHSLAMQISLIAFFAPDGTRQFISTHLSESESESLVITGVSAIANKMLDLPKSPFLGLIHRSAHIQLYAFCSCTGWVLMLGLEPGPYDSDEIARSFFERSISAIMEASMNPFFKSLSDSRRFNELISSTIQSHSVMMKFMASQQTLG